MARDEGKAPKWRPLVRATPIPKTEAEMQELAKSSGEPLEKIRATMADIEANETVWMNHRYQVHMRDGPEVVHLSIRRLDRRPVTDWRDKQRIKNQLVGEECEGMELFPAESRLVDTANQYHLWVVKDPGFRMPVGFSDGRVTNDNSGAAGMRQRAGAGK